MLPWLWDGVAAVIPSGQDWRTVAGHLAAGASPTEVTHGFGLTPRVLVAVIAADALGLDEDAGGPPLVQSKPGRPGLEAALSEDALAGLFPTAARPARLALAAGLLQVHDFWDASHRAAQEADDLGESSVSAYWHGIAHRREPDAGNAAYWFHRVGRHPLFAPLGAAARSLIEASAAGRPLADRLAPRGAWDPFAFVDYCTSPRGRDGALARRLQRLEMAMLLEASVPAG
jgi:hypothetical protein